LSGFPLVVAHKVLTPVLPAVHLNAIMRVKPPEVGGPSTPLRSGGTSIRGSGWELLGL
jgi:hypothetical protein